MNEYRPDVKAGNPHTHLMDPNGRNLLINEIFYSVQGEGSNAGSAAIFIRFAKCNLKCAFCDTEFEEYKVWTVESLVCEVLALADGARPLIIFTGGEPALQNVGYLQKELHDHWFDTCIETSGSVWNSWMSETRHICVSPKVPLARMPHDLCAELAFRGSMTERTKQFTAEIKWIVNKSFFVMFKKDAAAMYYDGLPNYLQPESQSPEWTKLALDYVKKFPSLYRLSVQTHKYIGER